MCKKFILRLLATIFIISDCGVLVKKKELPKHMYQGP